MIAHGSGLTGATAQRLVKTALRQETRKFCIKKQMVEHLALQKRRRPRPATQTSFAQVSSNILLAITLVQVDCVMGDWGEWGLCTQSCGGGLKGREQKVKVEPDHNGTECPTDIRETEFCNSEDCPEGKSLFLDLMFPLFTFRRYNQTRSALGI